VRRVTLALIRARTILSVFELVCIKNKVFLLYILDRKIKQSGIGLILVSFHAISDSKK